MTPLLLPTRRRAPRLRKSQLGYFIIDQYRLISDPYFDTVVQLAHFEDQYGSPRPSNYQLTNSCPRGNTLGMTNGSGADLTNAWKVFGTQSLRRNNLFTTGTAAAFATIHADYQFATADWTIEFRYRIDNVAVANYNLLDMRFAGTTGNTAVIYTYTNGRIAFYVNGAERIVSGAGVIASDTWYAIAASRVSGSTRLFVNGTQVGSTWADTTNYNASATICLGSSTAGNPINANWDELRISNGIYGAGAGRYAANYTVATAPFPDS